MRSRQIIATALAVTVCGIGLGACATEGPDDETARVTNARDDRHRPPSEAARSGPTPTTHATEPSDKPSPDVPSPGAPTPSADEPLLYYDHGQIHDGEVRVDYSAEGTPTYLARTAVGWLVREAWEHVGGQMVLVRRDGSVIDTYGFDDVGYRRFDVSDDGTAVALATGPYRTVRIVDAETGRRIRTVVTSLRSLSTVRYSGDDLVINGAGRTLLWDAGTGDLTELPYLQSGRISLVIDVSTDGQAALVDATVRVGARPCLSLYPVAPEATPRWRACDVSAYEGALSSDGSLVITIVARYDRSDGGGRLPAAPTTLEVIDTSSGTRLGSINPPGLLIDATWTADGNIFANTSTDRHFRAFGLYECTIEGDCEKVDSSEALPALGRIG